ncbi:MAG: GNAT family N-acetyltransferase [Alphaproteobacteria bacterium]
MAVALRTARLLLREWRDDDAAAFAALPADPRSLPHLPPPDADWVPRVRAHWKEHGFGQFVVELSGEAPFIGVVGLAHVRFALPFTPAVEAAWRLAPAYQGRGFAIEAARAAVADGFGRLGLGEIVAFTVPANEASRRVMTRLGMTRDPSEDFDHPRFPPGHKLRRHVLYRLGRPPA